MNRQTVYVRLALAMGLSTLLAACASSGKMPTEDKTAAENAIQQAESADARDFEPVLLNRAQNKVADAEQLIKAKKFHEAEDKLEQATVDAQLAAARSETAKARKAVEEINANIEQLRQRINDTQQ
ncbi:DUF4398 domain-containing protein [Marinobacter halodurans]|uniref:DUF4398 domain-containing protein n=1 Tax=Marinobacter halodurans TaxID=2528979 RepID=A0ABY1ZL07_9GAMM|nr:DUF4398 domain-containing protein [Marinobacter halodurans]TBW56402.1 DUF4398 domain-containing protein [Marinobacter halodurans]